MGAFAEHFRTSRATCRCVLHSAGPASSNHCDGSSGGECAGGFYVCLCGPAISRAKQQNGSGTSLVTRGGDELW